MTDLQNPQDLTDEQLEDVLVDIEVSVGGKPAGTMRLEFWPKAAPETVRNFTRYASEGFYDGKIFHRVIPGFMIQGGCPQGSGTGSGPRGMIPGEFSSDSQHSHRRGVLSMARSQDPNSASCQFFVCHGDADFLDGQYAAFGCLIDGEDALDAVAGVRTGGSDRPAEECAIESIKLVSRV
jgi:peptidyl-prolyl cis-trans isomerase B (cyclophilin B)